VKQRCTEKESGLPLLCGLNINYYDSTNSCVVLSPLTVMCACSS